MSRKLSPDTGRQALETYLREMETLLKQIRKSVEPLADQIFRINRANLTPLYTQLQRRIQSAITAGTLKVGDQLPTVRQMAVDLKINRNTVAKVYAALHQAGIVETHVGVGTFVRECSKDQA